MIAIRQSDRLGKGQWFGGKGEYSVQWACSMGVEFGGTGTSRRPQGSCYSTFETKPHTTTPKSR